MTPTTAGLAVINEGMTWEDRIEARVENINICCDTVQQSILFLGAQLAACKWSGEFIIDPVWPEEEESRSWANWLKLRDFKVTSANGQAKVDEKAPPRLWLGHLVRQRLLRPTLTAAFRCLCQATRLS